MKPYNYKRLKNGDTETVERLTTPEMVEILKDNTAYENFKKLVGMQ